MNSMMNLVRTLRRAALVVLACIATCAWTAGALAVPPTDAEAAGEQASKLFRQGNAAFEQKKWAEAEVAYREAWKIAHTFDVAANLGEVALHLGRPREAAKYLAFSLRAAPPSAKAAQRARTRHFLDEARQRVGAIRLSIDVSGARATIDGSPVDPEDLPFEVFVDPGVHTIAAQRDGYLDARATVRTTAGSTADVSLTLVPIAPKRRSVAPGAVLGGVAGAALVTGIGLYAAGRGKGASGASERDAILQAGRSCVPGAANFDARCADVESTANAANTFQKAGVGLMIGAGAAAVGTVLYFVLPTSSAGAKNDGLRVSPVVGTNIGGLALSGAF